MSRRTVLLWLVVVASVTMVGSGTIGPILPGWKVNQECTPIALGDTSGSVGSLSLDATATSTSVFAIDNDLVLTDSTSGTFRGNVVGSPVQGGQVRLDVAGKLNFLVADRTVDPVWFDAADPLLFGEMGSSTGQFTQPYAVAVDPYDDSVFVMSAGSGGVGRYVIVKFDAAGNYVTEFGSYGSGDGQFGGFAAIAVSPTDGSVAVGDGVNYRVQVFTPNVARTVYSFSAKIGSNGTGNGQFGSTSPIPVTFNSLGALYAGDRGNSRIQRFTISGAVITYSTQVALTGYSSIVPIYALAASSSGSIVASLVTSLEAGAPGELRFFNSTLTAQGGTGPLVAPTGTAGGIFNFALDSTGVWVNWGNSNYLSHLPFPLGPSMVEDKRWYSGYPVAADLNTNYGVAVKTTDEVVNLFKSTTFQTQPGLYGIKRVTTFDWSPVPLSTVIENYMLECDSTLGGLSYSYDASSDPDVVLPAWSGDVWSHLKELCTAYDLEIYLDDDTIRVADVGSRQITLRNNTPLKVEPTNLFGGRQLVIAATHATAGGGTVFDAAISNTRFQIDVGQRRTVTVSTTNYPVSVDVVVPTDTLPVLPGQYYVIDSTGTHVPAATWLAAGASVTAAIGASLGQIDFTLQGPATMSGYTGPFTFASSLASTATATLMLTGAGTFTAPEEITFDTGANETKTSQQVARTIRNFAIDTLERLYERAPQAIDDVSGVAVTVTFEMPTADLLGFGNTPGATFTTQDSIYRITKVTFGKLTAQVTAVRFVSLDDIDTITTGLTVDQRDAIWSGYSVDDRSIKPLALAL